MLGRWAHRVVTWAVATLARAWSSSACYRGIDLQWQSHREPKSTGYQQIDQVARNQKLSPLFKAEAGLTLTDLFVND